MQQLVTPLRLVTPLNNRRYINYFIYLSIYPYQLGFLCMAQISTDVSVITDRERKFIKHAVGGKYPLVCLHSIP